MAEVTEETRKKLKRIALDMTRGRVTRFKVRRSPGRAAVTNLETGKTTIYPDKD
jgi:hypothetical protein